MRFRLGRQGNLLPMAVVLAAACAACGEGEQTASGPNIVARSQKCTDTTVSKQRGATVTGSEWISGKFVVQVADVFNCARHDLASPAYTATGAEVSIRWAWKRPTDGPVAACECERKLTFELSGLKQDQYSVRLQRSE